MYRVTYTGILFVTFCQKHQIQENVHSQEEYNFSQSKFHQRPFLEIFLEILEQWYNMLATSRPGKTLWGDDRNFTRDKYNRSRKN